MGRRRSWLLNEVDKLLDDEESALSYYPAFTTVDECQVDEADPVEELFALQLFIEETDCKSATALGFRLMDFPAVVVEGTLYTYIFEICSINNY